MQCNCHHCKDFGQQQGERVFRDQKQNCLECKTGYATPQRTPMSVAAKKLLNTQAELPPLYILKPVIERTQNACMILVCW